jgi:hypothetical protein
MALLTADLDFETADVFLDDASLSVDFLTEFCAVMTRKLAALAGVRSETRPEPTAFTLPPYLAG